MTPGSTAWKLAFQLSPIILTNGLFNSFPGRFFPIIAITEAINFPLSALTGGDDINLERFFANWQPLNGNSLIDQDIAHYPFANRDVAANAVIAQPLNVSMLMTCPAQNRLGYYSKLAIMTALRATLAAHNAAGGTYIVATPSYIYTDCVMRSMRDASGNLTQQSQYQWQLDFEKPLITLSDAEQAQNGLMQMITSQLKITGEAVWSGLQTAASIPASLAGVSLVPAQSGAVAAGTNAASALVPV